MIRRLDQSLLIQFILFSVVSIASFIAALLTDEIFLNAVPLIIIGIYIALTDISYLFYCLLFFLPLSIEMELPGGFGTDFPDEILMVSLMLITLAILIFTPQKFNKALFYNPIILVLCIHFAWIIFTSITSSLQIVSLKYTISKAWYLTVFVILTSIIIQKIDNFKKVFWVIQLPLLFTVIYTLNRHYQSGFSFTSVNTTMAPFFRNHVSYAAMISIWIPFVWLARTWYEKKSFKRYFLNFCLLLFAAALFFSYTRTSWLALVAIVGIYFILKWKLMKWVLGAGLIMVAIFIFKLSSDFKYVEYAPRFEKSIYHEELGSHLSSTYKMEDISSNERLYRWVAGFRMLEANPLVGYGPGNFYNFYKGYTVNAFKTYVSANPERSTVHNYFILMMVEQGIIGLLIFILLTVVIFIYGEQLYHKCNNATDKIWILAVMMSMASIYVNNSLSDMIETDKVGTIFFMNIAMLAVLGYKYYPSKELKKV